MSSPDRRPTVSMLMSSYNHELFVEEAVASVLEQSFADLELIVVDDGSSDRSVERLRRFQDPRLRVIVQENGGPSAAFNTALGEARGEFVGLIASDDVCRKDRVERQLAHVRDARLDGVFSLAELVDEDGKTLDDQRLAVFFQSRWQTTSDLLSRLFRDGNFLCASTGFFRKSALDRVGEFRLGSLQLQDFDYWIRLAWHASLGRMEERLVKYRVRNDGANLSGAKNSVRTHFEYLMVMRAFFDEATLPRMQEAFPGLVSPDVAHSPLELELEKTFIFLSHGDVGVRTIGAERLYRHLDDPKARALLESRWDMGAPELHLLTRTLDLRNEVELEKLRALLQRPRREGSPEHQGASWR